MQLGNILSSAGTANPVTPRPVSFFAIGENAHLQQVKATVSAVLICVSELERSRSRVDAESALRTLFPDTSVPEEVLRDEQIYQLLFRALRDEDANEAGYHKPLAKTVTELRSALVLAEARRLNGEYEAFMAAEFPEKITDDEWKRLQEDAKKNYVSDLLTAYGSANVQRLVSFLGATSSR